MPIQIHGYIYQTCFFYRILLFVYPPIFVFISCLSTSNSLYLFLNPDCCLSLSTPFSLSQPNPHLSTRIYFYLFQSLVHPYLHISFSIPFSLSQSITHILNYIFFYLFAIPISRLYLSMLFSLFQSISHLFTSITFYLLYISLLIQVHAYLFSSLSLLIVKSFNFVHTVSLKWLNM